LSKQEWKQIDKAMREIESAGWQVAHASEVVRSMAATVLERLGYWKDGTGPRQPLGASAGRRSSQTFSDAEIGARGPIPTKRPMALNGDQKLGSPERKILSVLLQYPDGRTIKQLALLTGYAVGGGAFRNPMSRLRSSGLIDGREHVRITEAGAI